MPQAQVQVQPSWMLLWRRRTAPRMKEAADPTELVCNADLVTSPGSTQTAAISRSASRPARSFKSRLVEFARGAMVKLREGVAFFVRGVRLLGSDIRTAARLIHKAAVGGTLQPREVSALWRTARDIPTFVLFSIILLIPITPIGHVLVLWLINRYCPGFIPSCFTSKRQEFLLRYDELKQQLSESRTAAEQAEEELADALLSKRQSGCNEAGSTTQTGEGDEEEDTCRQAQTGKQQACPIEPPGDSTTAVALANRIEIQMLKKRVAAVLDALRFGGDKYTGVHQDAGQAINDSHTKNE